MDWDTADENPEESLGDSQPSEPDEQPVSGEDFTYTGVLGVDCVPNQADLPDGSAGWTVAWQVDPGVVIITNIWTSRPDP